MNVEKHITLVRQGILERIKILSKPINTREIAIGAMSGLCGALDDKRYLKIDKRSTDGPERHFASRKIIENFLERYNPALAKSWTHLAAAIVCTLYQSNKLTATVNPARLAKQPENPVALVNDSSTGPADVPSEININDLREVA